MTPTTIELFDAIDLRFRNLNEGVLCDREWTLEEYKYLANKILACVDNMFHTPWDTMKEGNQVVFRIHDVTSKHGDERSRILGKARENMDALRTEASLPPEPVHNDCEIVINTVCGEKQTIQMTQEINSIEYMGKTLTKEDNEFTSKLEGLEALFG